MYHLMNFNRISPRSLPILEEMINLGFVCMFYTMTLPKYNTNFSKETALNNETWMGHDRGNIEGSNLISIFSKVFQHIQHKWFETGILAIQFVNFPLHIWMFSRHMYHRKPTYFLTEA